MTNTIPDFDALAKLREPLPAEAIGKLPRYTGRKTTPKNEREKGSCRECGGYHEFPSIHLDYAGHAAVTDRLLDADPEWTWEPADRDFLDRMGLTAARCVRDGTASLWIALTVGGVTRYGVGTCEAGKDDVDKQLIGDALRNAAMRFGVALDLWHKGGDLGHADEPDEPAATAPDRDAWLLENGWESRAEYDAARKANRERFKALDPTDDEKVAHAKWMRDHEIDPSKTWTRDQLEAVSSRITALEAERSKPAGGDATEGASPPAGPPDDDADEAGWLAYVKGKGWHDLEAQSIVDYHYATDIHVDAIVAGLEDKSLSFDTTDDGKPYIAEVTDKAKGRAEAKAAKARVERAKEKAS